MTPASHNHQPQPLPLPATPQECAARGWDQVDIVLVSGDAYIDHPSFGIALIGRLLAREGYRVAILAQPRFDRPDDFRIFGQPRLFFGISGGNLDSIVANYSGNGKVRDQDSYSPDGNPWRGKTQSKEGRRRPDRAALIYAGLARAAYKNIPVILGGVEASLRRFIHYDYKQAKLRGSVLTEAKANLLVYGMGERAVVEVAHRLASGNKNLSGIPGTCERLTERGFQECFPTASEARANVKILPGWKAIQDDVGQFMKAERLIDRQARARMDTILAQQQQNFWLIQHPAAVPLSTIEMDALYDLPFSRRPHPSTPNVPAHAMIRDSITIVRGCSGNCSFCAITRHQGPEVSSRSQKSIIREAQTLAAMDDFSGTISDLGGPTANLYGTSCRIGGCKKHDCLYPKLCTNLNIDEESFLKLLKQTRDIPGVKHVFISSGLRMELLRSTPRLMRAIIRDHCPGMLKIAPEHTESEVLKLMHKEDHSELQKFVRECQRINRELKRPVRLSPYLISAHPGCTDDHCRAMVPKLRQLGLPVRQFQDFTPTPGTLATAMYVTGLNRDRDQKIFVARTKNERSRQRQLLEQLLEKRTSKQPASNQWKKKGKKR
ncbi:MAG: YgiQ family radical SAM protein [Desulfobulbaceae bacterium]|uniref:YgiQ family radical SAM protein n=1 Tax=Candidatus Desulfatifera sulfidica TaxID=2841691 RepID=A0A8J6TDQ8_9BACT|nr:YgiQ family radical SAM protein [Candidatus Desulfatifera sulfidica]